MGGWKLDDDYKRRKEAFVTGLSGGAASEVLAVVSAFPLAVFASTAGLAFITACGGRPATWRLPFRIAYEVCTIVFPTLASLTIAADAEMPMGSTSVALLATLAAAPLLLEAASRLALGEPLLYKPALSLRSNCSSITKTAKSSPEASTAALASVTQSRDEARNAQRHDRPAFVTAFRAGVMLTTCIAILAVDFPVFPRRFAKTETFGTSVMDIGVGAFVFAAALVSRQTRRGLPRLQVATSGPETTGAHAQAADEPSHVSPRKKTSKAPRMHSYLLATDKVRDVALAVSAEADVTLSLISSLAAAGRALASTLLSVTPLVVLGGARFAVNTHRNHQEHVSEHGVHWSFFLSMAVVALLATAVEGLLGVAASLRAAAGCSATTARRPPSPFATTAGYLVAGVALASAYQLALTSPLAELPAAARLHAVLGPHAAAHSTLQGYILHAERFPGHFVSQNREGLASVIGFLALHLAGVGVGRMVLDPQAAASPAARARRSVALAAVAAAFWTALVVVQSSAVGLPVSRRLVNLPYVLWVLALNTTVLLGFLTVDAVVGEAKAPPLPSDDKASHPLSCFSARALHTGSVVCEAVNTNFLAVFMGANLITGAVNAALVTLDTPNGAAFAVLAAYMSAVAALAVAPVLAGVSLKVW